MFKNRVIPILLCLAVPYVHCADKNIDDQEIELVNNIEASQRKLKELSDIIKVLGDDEQSFIAARILEFEHDFEKMQSIRKENKYEDMIKDLTSLKQNLEQRLKVIEQYAHDALAKKRINSPGERDVFENKVGKPALNIQDDGIQYVTAQDPSSNDNENEIHSENPQ